MGLGRRECRVAAAALLRLLPPAYALLFGECLPWRSVGGALAWKASPRNRNACTTLASKCMRMHLAGSGAAALSGGRAARLLCSATGHLSQRVLPEVGGKASDQGKRSSRQEWAREQWPHLDEGKRGVGASTLIYTYSVPVSRNLCKPHALPATSCATRNFYKHKPCPCVRSCDKRHATSDTRARRAPASNLYKS